MTNRREALQIFLSKLTVTQLLLLKIYYATRSFSLWYAKTLTVLILHPMSTSGLANDAP